MIIRIIIHNIMIIDIIIGIISNSNIIINICIIIIMMIHWGTFWRSIGAEKSERKSWVRALAVVGARRISVGRVRKSEGLLGIQRRRLRGVRGGDGGFEGRAAESDYCQPTAGRSVQGIGVSLTQCLGKLKH